jgi:hypothetical protein
MVEMFETAWPVLAFHRDVRCLGFMNSRVVPCSWPPSIDLTPFAFLLCRGQVVSGSGLKQSCYLPINFVLAAINLLSMSQKVSGYHGSHDSHYLQPTCIASL